MKPSVFYWQSAGFIFTSIVGTLLHFLFDWTGQNVVAALFSAVNESIFEHMKLLFYPMFAFALIQNRFMGSENFWCIKLKGMLLGLGLIPILYYTYTGILGTSADWFNIAIFFLAAGAAFWWEAQLFKKNQACSINALPFILLIAVAFPVLTFYPPHIPFFRDPQTGTYGFTNFK